MNGWHRVVATIDKGVLCEGDPILSKRRSATALLLCGLLLSACAGDPRQEARPESRPRAAPSAPAPRPTIELELESDREPQQQLRVRDLITSESYTIESRRGLLALGARDGVIDTLSTPISRLHRGATLQLADSSFVRIEGRTGGVGSSDLIGVIDGRLVWAARLPSRHAVTDSGAPADYRTTYRLLRSPRSVSGSEIFEGRRVRWEKPFDLRFDDSARVFYNTSVALDSVPIAESARLVSGRHPGIALRGGTTVYIDGHWYSLSLIEDLDPDELAAGTVGLVLEGKGEWGDTLRAVR